MCCFAECLVPSILTFRVIISHGIMLSVVVQKVIKLSVILANVIAPKCLPDQDRAKC